jgi:tRNA pseudouridine38-40 synthase
MPTQRYKLTIAYRGTRYHGWQRQVAASTWKGEPLAIGEGIPTIQETLSRAIVSVVRHPVTLIGSSRTDAGVHAKGQLAHFDTDQLQIPPEGMRQAINARLPEDVVVRAIEAVPASFDAIGSTVEKRYQYCIWCERNKPVFTPELVWHRWQPMDLGRMQEAARRLVGTHDFASFAKPGHGRSDTVRTITECSVSRRGRLVVIGVAGTGFLWNMVRIIVSTLVDVGGGRFAPGDIDAMLAARTRSAAGGTAPPQGLYLQWIRTAPREKGDSPLF